MQTITYRADPQEVAALEKRIEELGIERSKLIRCAHAAVRAGRVNLARFLLGDDLSEADEALAIQEMRDVVAEGAQ